MLHGSWWMMGHIPIENRFCFAQRKECHSHIKATNNKLIQIQVQFSTKANGLLEHILHIVNLSTIHIHILFVCSEPNIFIIFSVFIELSLKRCRFCYSFSFRNLSKFDKGKSVYIFIVIHNNNINNILMDFA